MSEQKQSVREIGITINDVREDKRVEKGFFSDRLYDEVSVFMSIDYELGVPTFRKEEGQKEQVGYRYWYTGVVEGGDCSTFIKTREELMVPQRQVFRVQDNEYKMMLKPNDDFQQCIGSLAQVLVEAQGMTYLRYDQRVKTSPNLKVEYGSAELEDKLKRL